MKILHTSDWHLGKKLESFSRLEEQKEVLEEINDIANREKVDAVLIAGDLFDTFNPPADAVDLFYKTLKKLSNYGKRAVIAIAGNHDSPDRIEVPNPLARECGIIFTGYPNAQIPSFELDSGLSILNSGEGFIELKLPGVSAPLRLILTPYANEYRLKAFLGTEDPEAELRNVLEEQWEQLARKYCDTSGVNILMTHLFLIKKGEALPEEPESEKPIHHVGGTQAVFSENIPGEIQYVALGHLHRYREIDRDPCPMVYSSSPLSYSFSEAGQEKNVVLIEATPGEPVRYRPVALCQGRDLYRKRFENVDQAVAWLKENPGCLVELTMATDDYLSADDRKKLHNAHDGIVTIIPEVKNALPGEHGQEHHIDLNKDMESLFKDYFKYKHGQEPNEEITSIFREVLGSGKNK